MKFLHQLDEDKELNKDDEDKVDYGVMGSEDMENDLSDEYGKFQSKQLCQKMKEKSKEIGKIGKWLRLNLKQRKKEMMDLLRDSNSEREEDSELSDLEPMYPLSNLDPLYPLSNAEPLYPLEPLKPASDLQPSYPASDLEPSYPVSDLQPSYPVSDADGEKSDSATQSEDRNLGVTDATAASKKMIDNRYNDGTNVDCCPRLPFGERLAGEINTERCKRCEDQGDEEVCGANGQTYKTLCHAINCAGLALRDVVAGACNTKVRK